MIEKIFDTEINRIIKEGNPIAILLIGSAASADKKDFGKLRDIDIFVITEEASYLREVVDKEGVEFDISYLPVSLLEEGINDRKASLINVLHKSKLLYSSNSSIHKYLREIEKIYIEGPKQLSEDEIRYIRFKLCQMYETILSRSSDDLNVTFLLSNFIKELIYSYFKLNKIWPPSEKKVMQTISKIDNMLYGLITSYYYSNNKDDKIKIVNDMLKHVLEPFGGTLKYWEKAEYPFDFT